MQLTIFKVWLLVSLGLNYCLGYLCSQLSLFEMGVQQKKRTSYLSRLRVAHKQQPVTGKRWFPFAAGMGHEALRPSQSLCQSADGASGKHVLIFIRPNLPLPRAKPRASESGASCSGALFFEALTAISELKEGCLVMIEQRWMMRNAHKSRAYLESS